MSDSVTEMVGLDCLISNYTTSLGGFKKRSMYYSILLNENEKQSTPGLIVTAKLQRRLK